MTERFIPQGGLTALGASHTRQVGYPPQGLEPVVPNTLLTDLIGYWDLNESSATRFDSTANGLDLTDHNTVGSAAGKLLSSAAFIEANLEYLTHASNPLLSVGGSRFFASAWVYITTLATADNSQIICGKWGSGPTNLSWALIWRNPTSALWFGVRTAVGVTWTVVGTAGLALNTWHHVIGHYSGSAGNTIDVQVNNGPISAPVAVNPGGLNPDVAPFAIGAEGGGAFAPDARLEGRVDEVGFWKGHSPSTEDRDALWNGGAGLSYSRFL